MRTSPNRREFLTAAAGVVGAAGLPSGVMGAASGGSRPPLARSCIFINMVGGPSHLDTFDPKPTAKIDDRGPFRPIRTRVPGMHVSELFPKLAAISDKFTLLRGMHHDGPPVHEAGLQLLNTGRLFRDGPEWPNVGAVLEYLDPHSKYHEPTMIVPFGSIDTGLRLWHGQSSSWLDTKPTAFAELFETDDLRTSMAELFPKCVDQLSTSLMFCSRLIGLRYARFAIVNQFSTVFDRPSWDCHADRGSLNTTLVDIRDNVAPSFDTAFAQLLTDLESRGLLDTTLVIATGEFGRTPWFNCNGGRDHWANAWTAIVAGGGTKGGQVIGATDRAGAEVIDRPTTPQELVATIFHAMGVPANATIPGPEGTPVEVYPGSPIRELF